MRYLCAKRALAAAVAVTLWFHLAAAASAQSGAESSVGYIDSAIPVNQLRLRFDSAYNSNVPTRAEFFYSGGGLPKPEARIDYQEQMTYLERAWVPQFSTFLEVPVLWLYPQINTPTNGLSDVNTGFKYALQYEPDRITTFQTRIYAPTGNTTRGLGTGHVSIEPALLFFRKYGERLFLEGELRDWIPVGGDTFEGNIVRYGAGVSYRVINTPTGWVAPVTEWVGWTVLNGEERRFPLGDITSAGGNTIVNAKIGVRLGWTPSLLTGGDIFIGYGRALTGDVWYKDMLRVEMRLRF